MKPACMTDAEYREWQQQNRLVRYPAPSPCSDCLAGFALEMRAEGRCDGHPRGYQDDERDPASMTAPVAASVRSRALRKTQRIAVVMEMTERGEPIEAIAARLGVKPKTIYHYRYEYRHGWAA